MSNLCIAVEKIYAGSADFYKELDDPRLRFIKVDVLHTTFKVAAVSVFALGTTVYVGWKTLADKVQKLEREL